MSTSSETVLIERVAELDALEHAVAALAGRTGGIVVLEAAAGLGKTALLEHAARLAAASAGALLLDGEMPRADSATAIAHGVMWLCAGLTRTEPAMVRPPLAPGPVLSRRPDL